MERQPEHLSRTLSTAVVRSLREAIYQRELPSGSRLIDSELAKQLAVSRGTVRNALQTLTFEGLVESRPNRGFYVTDSEPEQVIELLELRAMLESRAAAAAVSHLTDDDLDELSAIADQIGASSYRDDVQLVRDLDVEFHTIVTRRCGKPLLLELWASLNSRLCMLDILCVEILEITADESADRHREYIQRLHTRCPQQAYEAGAEHYHYHVRRYRQRLGSSGAPATDGRDAMKCH